MYQDLDKLCEEMDKLSTSVTIIAGDFNAKVGKRIGNENCLGTWSRGRRNNNGTKLMVYALKGGVYHRTFL